MMLSIQRRRDFWPAKPLLLQLACLGILLQVPSVKAEQPMPGWEVIGAIEPQSDLQPGDLVRAVALTNRTVREEHSATIEISTASEGKGAIWARKLAQRLNVVNATSQIRAGQVSEKGEIEPVIGSNLVYAGPESVVNDIELIVVNAPDRAMKPGAIAPFHGIYQGKVSMHFPVTTDRPMYVSASLINESGDEVGSTSQWIDTATHVLELVAPSEVGSHTLKLEGIHPSIWVIATQRFVIDLVPGAGENYDHLFPVGLASYKAGTRVLQPKTGAVFECRPFPHEGWCRTYSQSDDQYEPGIGKAWREAWIEH
ncbi:hypothetical protein [Pseudomonas sp.]|uniref:hypothetical protein n=1 Tax=Pseudomonas sp. TaxID=306 RepID=UPI0031DBAD0B